MPRFSKFELTQLYEEVMVWAGKVEEMEKLSEGSVGEVRSAYAIVHKDYLWKLQSKIGKLWYYACGIDEMSPFEGTPSEETITHSE
jgi:hypothetical protein